RGEDKRVDWLSVSFVYRSLGGHHHEECGDDRRRHDPDDQGGSLQRVRALFVGKDHHYCVDGGECDYSESRGQSRPQRLPKEVVTDLVIRGVLWQSVAAELVAAARAESQTDLHALIQHAAPIVTMSPQPRRDVLGGVSQGRVRMGGVTLLPRRKDLPSLVP